MNFAIRPGEIVGLAGPSGAGKSTLGDILLGLVRPSQGQVYWKGSPIFRKGKHNRAWKKTMRYYRCDYQKIYQDPLASFCPRQTLGDALKDVVRYHAIQNPSLEKSLERLGLATDMLNRFPRQLSGGELQRMALIRVMLLKPDFIVADEPTSRLDLSVQAHIIRLIAGFSRSNACAILLISHDTELIQVVCDRCIYLDHPFQ